MTRNENLYNIKRPNLRGVPHNKTTLFMLPSIGFKEEKTGIRLLRYYGFVNCYLSHKQAAEDYPGCLTLIFNPTNEALAKFRDFYNVYRTYPNFVDDYMVDHNLIAVVFRVLPKWLGSFEEFKKSRYSHMSKDYADMFKRIDMNSGLVKVTDEYFVMKRDKEFRQKLEQSLDVEIDNGAELMDLLDPTQENFDYGDTKK